MRISIILAFLSLNISVSNAQTTVKPALVNYNDYEKLVKEVKVHREKRLISLNEFVKLSKEKEVVILDARPKNRYDARHVKNAVNLNFADFTQDNLAQIIPSPNTLVLIYCNNNFEDDRINFASKVVIPSKVKPVAAKPITLALNIPTYINLYGYGYRNVYELKELVSVNDKRLVFEGSAVRSNDLAKRYTHLRTVK